MYSIVIYSLMINCWYYILQEEGRGQVSWGCLTNQTATGYSRKGEGHFDNITSSETCLLSMRESFVRSFMFNMAEIYKMPSDSCVTLCLQKLNILNNLIKKL